MLEFTSEQHFLSTVDSLNDLRETHINNFMRDYENDDDDVLFEAYEVSVFDEDLPLKQFESAMNFSSLREEYDGLLYDWLSRDSLNMTTYPGNDYAFSPAEMTLLNRHGEVKIGDRFIIFTNQGYIDIANNDTTTFIAIKSGDIPSYSEPSVTHTIDFINAPTTPGDGSCAMWKSKSWSEVWGTGNNRMVIMTMSFGSFPWFAQSKAKICSYRLKNNGNWTGFSRDLGVSLQSTMQNNNCSYLAQAYSGFNVKRRKCRQKVHTRWGYGWAMRCKNDFSIYGTFTFGGVTRVRYLEW